MRTLVFITALHLISSQESCKKLPETPNGICTLVNDCPAIDIRSNPSISLQEVLALAGDCQRKEGYYRFCCPVASQPVSHGSSGIIHFPNEPDVPSQQCSGISISSEKSGTYKGLFTATATTSFVGMTVEFTFDNTVDSLEFSAGFVEKVSSTRFKLLSSGWKAEPGWGIDFSFTPHFTGSKPIVVGVLLNDIDIC